MPCAVHAYEAWDCTPYDAPTQGQWSTVSEAQHVFLPVEARVASLTMLMPLPMTLTVTVTLTVTLTLTLPQCQVGRPSDIISVGQQCLEPLDT